MLILLCIYFSKNKMSGGFNFGGGGGFNFGAGGGSGFSFGATATSNPTIQAQAAATMQSTAPVFGAPAQTQGKK